MLINWIILGILLWLSLPIFFIAAYKVLDNQPKLAYLMISARIARQALWIIPVIWISVALFIGVN